MAIVTINFEKPLRKRGLFDIMKKIFLKIIATHRKRLSVIWVKGFSYIKEVAYE